VAATLGTLGLEDLDPFDGEDVGTGPSSGIRTRAARGRAHKGPSLGLQGGGGGGCW